MGLHLTGSSLTTLNNAYARLSGVQATRTTDGALVAGQHNPVDASGGNRTVTLADATDAGQLVVVSKKDSTANTVTVSVAHLRDGGAGTIVLVGQYEALTLTSKADGTWWPIGDHKTKAYLDGAFSRKQVKVSDLPNPWFLAHRGGGANLAPENTIEGFRIGASLGTGIIDGGDWWTTGDGSLITMHDGTFDRTTTKTGNVSLGSAMGASQAVVDASSWFGGGYADTRVPTAEEIFGTFGGSVVMTPEAKSQAAATALAAIIKRLGLQESMIPNAFNDTWLAAFVAIGCKDVALNISAMPSSGQQTAYLAAGINWLWIDYTGSVTPANITTLVNAGFKIALYDVYRAVHVSPYSSVLSSISGFLSDDPLYFSHAINATNAATYRRTADPFKTQAYYHGHLSGQPGSISPQKARGTFLNYNRWGLQTTTTAGGAANMWNLQGWACPLSSPTTHTISLNLAFDALGGDTSRWGGGFHSQATDDIFMDAGASTENGYEWWFRANGQLNLVKKTAGVNGTTQSVSTTAISAPLTTSGALAAGATITTLPVTAIPSALAVGVKLALPSGDIATVASAASASATSVTISSLTLSNAIASGASIPQAVPITVAVTGTTVTVTRTDTGQSVSVTDNAFRGAYWFLGANDSSGTTGLHVSFSNITIS